MTKTKRLGFLGGGNMSGTLIRGLLKAGVPADRIAASDPRMERLAELRIENSIRTTTDNRVLVAESDVVVLAVKPQALDSVLREVGHEIGHHQLVISIAAGVALQAIEAHLPDGSRVIRAMPNTPATVLAGVTALAAGSHSSDDDMRDADELFQAVGRVTVLGEGQLDAVTGLSGSGPAYVMVIVDALADGGVKMGLSRETALLLAAQTVFGAAKLLLETGEHPARLKDLVTSPGGTTAAGLHALERGAIRSTLINAVEAATARATVLGSEMLAKLKP